MKRRTVSAALAGSATLTALGLRPAAAAVPPGLVLGKDYATLDKPVPIGATGKIEVVEFFWYGCPHCYAFEPFIEPWVAKLPDDVHFRRVAYGFDEALREVHQQVFYTWETLGLVDRMHAKTFDQFNKANKPINDEAAMLNFAASNGLDVAQVKAAWNGFSVQTRMRQARQFCDAYGVDFVPMMGIQGKYLTAPSMAGDGDKALAAADTLINLVRKGS